MARYSKKRGPKAYRKKVTYRQMASQTARIPLQIGGSMGTAARARLPISQGFNLTLSDESDAHHAVLMCVNDLVNPFPNVANEYQASGFDQYAAFYERYAVVGFYAKITYIRYDTSRTHAIYNTYVDRDASVLTNLSRQMTMPGVITSITNANVDGNIGMPRVHKRFINVAKELGIDRVTNFGGTIGTCDGSNPPSQRVYLHLCEDQGTFSVQDYTFTHNSTTYTPPKSQCFVQGWYDVVFMDRLPLPTSTS